MTQLNQIIATCINEITSIKPCDVQYKQELASYLINLYIEKLCIPSQIRSHFRNPSMIPDITDNRLIFMAIHDDKYKSDRTAVTATTFFDKIKFERAIDKIRLDCGEENVVFFDTVMQKYVFMPCYTIQDTDAEWEMCMSDADMLWVIEHDIIRVITNSIVCTNQDELFARIPTEYRRM